MKKKFEYTWEQAIEMLRKDPQHQKLIHDSYLTQDLDDNCHRFYAGSEFTEVLQLVKRLLPGARKVLDIPAGNGIAAYAFAKSGFEVVAVEPDSSASVGRGAIEYIRDKEGLTGIRVVDAYSENLPCEDEEFDVVYIRQGLHHAHDLQKMMSEAARVTRSGGLIIAAREPVVDDYNGGLQAFLDSQPDHQLYGGENAFTHSDYLDAFRSKHLSLIHDLGPYDSIINLAPNTLARVESTIQNSRTGKLLGKFLPSRIAYRLGLSILSRRHKEQGRLHTFIARKEAGVQPALPESVTPRARLGRYLKTKEATHPRAVELARRTARRLAGKRVPTHPFTMRREIAAVAEVLRGPFWNMNYGRGLAHERLEEEFAAYVGTRYAVATNTGGMAIQMALRAFGVKPGDEVLHQVDTCVADAFAVIAAGGTPIFGDVNEDNFMLSPTFAEDQISAQTRVIMPVHMWGNPENLDWVNSVADKHSLFVLEDACLALGAEWKGRKVGSIGHAGVFSFGCLKPIQAGEGGIIVTDDEALARELRTMRNWGDMSGEYGVRDQKTLSWNGRVSEIVAAVALEQLRGYPRYFEKLQDLVTMFIDHLRGVEGIDIVVPKTAELKPAYSQVVVRLDSRILGISKTELMKRLNENGIGAWHANFEPMNALSFFREQAWKDWVLRGDIDKVERNYNHRFVNSEKVYESLGMGFAKDNFLSSDRVKSLIRELDRAIANPLN